MSEVGLIEIRPNKHLIKCPHCKEQTVHNWPGTTILFSTVQCTHCGREFVVTLNQPQRDA